MEVWDEKDLDDMLEIYNVPKDINIKMPRGDTVYLIMKGTEVHEHYKNFDNRMMNISNVYTCPALTAEKIMVYKINQWNNLKNDLEEQIIRTHEDRKDLRFEHDKLYVLNYLNNLDNFNLS